jgi:hypothetical protein
VTKKAKASPQWPAHVKDINPITVINVVFVVWF